MGTRFLLDTNSVIYYLDNALPKSTMIFLDKVLDVEAFISVISKIELLSWSPPIGVSLKPVQHFVNTAIILPLTDEVVRKTIDIRCLRKMKLPDAIIAATAIVHNLDIISRNKSDFSNIRGFTCYDPFTELLKY